MAIGCILTMNIILTMNGIPIFPRFCHWGAYAIISFLKLVNDRPNCSILELVVRLAHKYGLGEKNVRCLRTHSCVLQLLQLLPFATTIYLSKMTDPSKKHAH